MPRKSASNRKTASTGARPLKVLIAASEVAPFAKTGGLADVTGALPQVLTRLGVECAVILPRYRCVSVDKFHLKTQVRGMQIPMGMGEVDASLLCGSMPDGKTPVWFVQNDRYFDREGLYGTPEGDYPDNAERFAFFSRAVLESLRALSWYPDVLHLNDWQTGLVGAYLRTRYASEEPFARVRTLFTIHNLAYHGSFPKYVLPMTGLGWEEFHHEKLEFYDQVNYLKAGLAYSDALSTVSPSYAREIQTEEYGHGLHGVLQHRARDLHGIVNGVDYGEWNPATDRDLPAQYTPKNPEKKAESKRLLASEIGLPHRKDAPLLGMVTRLTDQKGLDLLAGCLDDVLAGDVQIAVLGTGEARYHRLLEDMRAKYPDKLGVALRFDHRLAKLVYAGSDIFLMPSRFEPCGLGQLIALKYGTVPVVRRTGGLADTIENFSPDGRRGTGFSFEGYHSEDFLRAVRRALEAFHQPKLWRALMTRGMQADFSWEASAQRYRELYEHLRDRDGAGHP